MAARSRATAASVCTFESLSDSPALLEGVVAETHRMHLRAKHERARAARERAEAARDRHRHESVPALEREVERTALAECDAANALLDVVLGTMKKEEG